jgi:transcription elongation factor SPT6
MEFIEREASLDPDEDEEFDEDAGEGRPKATNGKQKRGDNFDDSSEEEDDDDDEEAAMIRDGFIVDDGEEEDEEMEDGTMVKVKRRRKRRRSHRDEEEDEVLDEEDLDLMLENTGEGTRDTKVCLRRLSFSRLRLRGVFRASSNG